MNKYLTKIAASVVGSDADYLNKAYDMLILTTGAKTIETGNPFSKRYWDAAWKTGGNYMSWDVSKDSDGSTKPTYSLVHAKPNVLTRLLSPAHSIIEPKDVTDTTYSLGKVHEGIEAQEHLNHEFPLWKDIIEGTPGDKLTPESTSGHVNLAVIMRESNIVNSLKNKNLVQKHTAERKDREDHLLYNICKKVYGDHFTDEDIARARHFHYKTVNYEA